MSVREHRSAASSAPARVAVLTVSSTRTAQDDSSGALLAEQLEGAGHTVVARRLVDDDRDAIRAAVRELAASDAQAAILTGGTGLSARDVTPEALAPLFTKSLPGFGEIFRALSYQEVGAAAMMSRATAGLVGGLLVFALPGSTKACALALRELILPELSHMLSQASKEGFEAVPDVVPDAVEAPESEEAAEAADPSLPPPSGSLGGHGVRGMSVEMGDAAPQERPADAEEIPDRGWKRAVYELSAEVAFDAREALPQHIEKLSPVLNILESAGEFAVLKLPNGVKYSLFGWPDLRRPSSKVLAVGWGEPLAEVIALHRYPTLTGTCIEESRGQLPDRWKSVEDIAEKVCGRPPKNTDGELFAMDGQSVWIQRGQRVFKWDGSNEREEGNFKQVLVSLMMDWHTR